MKEIRLQRKIIVYVEFATTALELATKLNGFVCYGKMGDEDKAANIYAFRAASNGCIMTTSALTEGIHFHDIDTVIRIGLPASLISYNQETGRGGRDGRECEAILITSNGIKNTYFAKASEAMQLKIQAYVQRGFGTQQCRRRVLDEYFDGNAKRTMCLPAEARCDVCEERLYRPSQIGYIQQIQEGGQEDHIGSNHRTITTTPAKRSSLVAPTTPYTSNSSTILSSSPCTLSITRPHTGFSSPTRAKASNYNTTPSRVLTLPNLENPTSKSPYNKLTHKRNYSQGKYR
jgi:superfamily II DNA helicase RecQ